MFTIFALFCGVICGFETSVFGTRRAMICGVSIYQGTRGKNICVKRDGLWTRSFTLYHMAHGLV